MVSVSVEMRSEHIIIVLILTVWAVCHNLAYYTETLTWCNFQEQPSIISYDISISILPTTFALGFNPFPLLDLIPVDEFLHKLFNSAFDGELKIDHGGNWFLSLLAALKFHSEPDICKG